MAQREWLREVIEDRGHKVIYYPKYHCELNPIEMAWAYMKAYLRKHCTYSFSDLHDMLPKVIEDQIPIAFIRRAFRHCFRFMSGYRLGLQGPLLDYSLKQYKGHRQIPNNVIDQLKSDFEKVTEEKKNKRRKK